MDRREMKTRDKRELKVLGLEGPLVELLVELLGPEALLAEIPIFCV